MTTLRLRKSIGRSPLRLGFIFISMTLACFAQNVAVGADAEAVPNPLHEWTFEDGTAKDSVGDADGVLIGGASITDGRLNVGPDRYMMTSALAETISVKTLVSWVSLATLSQHGGSALTIENTSTYVGTNYFDAIDFAERVPRQWMAGSDFYNRSPEDNGGAPETQRNTDVMIAIVYGSDNSITIYRNGVLYARYTMGTLQTYIAGSSDAVIGLRHTTCESDCFLTGSIDEAQIYGIALSAREIEKLYKHHQECLQPPTGLVGWWSGDRTAEDVQGTNNGRLLNGASFTKGMVGPGFLFDGVNDGVKIPNSASLSPTRITLDAWVYLTGKLDANKHVISKDNETRAREYILAINGNRKVEPFVRLNTGDFLVSSTTIVQLNTWYHIAMTHDGATLRVYVNGVLEGSLAAVGDLLSTANPVGMGGNALPVFFQGIIDEAQIFDRALTDAEILAIYQAGAAGQCKPEIFVASITPSYEIVGHGFLVSTSVVIQDENGNGIEDASAQIKIILPSGSGLDFPATTDATGQATISFGTQDSGLYKFKVRRVTHPTREYNPSLNIETTDTLVIP